MADHFNLLKLCLGSTFYKSSGIQLAAGHITGKTKVHVNHFPRLKTNGGLLGQSLSGNIELSIFDMFFILDLSYIEKYVLRGGI